MSNEKQVVEDELIKYPPKYEDESLLFDDGKKNVAIQSQGVNQPQTNVTIEAEIINNTIRYMVLKGNAWPNPHQAFIHLSMIFMNRNWYSENDLATKIKSNFHNAPFTVDQTKKALQKLGRLGVLEMKPHKGTIKYKLSDLGISMIAHDRVITQSLNIGVQQNQPSTQQGNDGETAAMLTANTGAEVEHTEIVEGNESSNKEGETQKIEEKVEEKV